MVRVKTNHLFFILTSPNGRNEDVKNYRFSIAKTIKISML